MEANKSQGVQLASRSLRRADGVVPVHRLAGSRPRKSRCFSSSPKAGKIWCSCWKARSRRNSLYLAFLFYLGLQLTGRGPAMLGRQSALFSLLIQMLISSKNTLTYTPKIRFDQISGQITSQSSWHIKLSITDGLIF